MIRPTVALCALAVLSPITGLRAQTMTRDQSSGDYVISYHVGENSHQIVVPSADRISPGFELTGIGVESGVWTYEYTLTNRNQAPAIRGRGLLTLMLECPRGSRTLNQEIQQPAGRNDAAQQAMSAFATELRVRRGQQVPEAGYLMLATMRQYLLRNM